MDKAKLLANLVDYWLNHLLLGKLLTIEVITAMIIVLVEGAIVDGY